MNTIFEVLRRIQRLPRLKRIEHLSKLASLEKPRSVRKIELTAALKREVRERLRDEIILDHITTALASAPIGHGSPENDAA